MFKKYVKSLCKVEQIIKSNGQVFIFGAASLGVKVKEELQELGIEAFAFLDNHNQSERLCGLPIYNPAYVAALTRGQYFIMCAFGRDSSYWHVRRQLELLGLVEGEDFADFSANCDARYYRDAYSSLEIPADNYDLRQKRIEKALVPMRRVLPTLRFDADTLITRSFDLKINTYCNRNCKSCFHRIPYVKNRRHYDADKIVADLDKLLGANMYVPSLVILGGEPLLHPKLDKILINLAAMENLDHIGEIGILTNSTIVPDKKVLQAAQRLDKLFFNLNEYKDDANSSNKVVEIKDACDAYGVKYVVATDHGKYVWYDIGDPLQCRGRSPEELAHQCYVCKTFSVQMVDGKAYGCGTAATPMFDGLVPESKTDYVDVRNASSKQALHDEMWELLYRTPYYTNCNYCDGREIGAKEIPVGF